MRQCDNVGQRLLQGYEALQLERRQDLLRAPRALSRW